MAEDKAPIALQNPTKAQLIFFSWAKDILIYIIVLNLFVEYNYNIVIDSFTISIFTAILLKILLEIVFKFEHKVSDVFKDYKVLRISLVWIILFGSKLLILEVVNLVFGEHVELGHFLDVIVLVIALIVARELVEWVYRSLGEREPEATQ